VLWRSVVLIECRWQMPTLGSALRLSDDHQSFYVGYSFSGLVEQYATATGMLLRSAVHGGDVLTLTVVRPDVLCTSGSDGQLRLLEMFDYCAVPPSTFKTTVPLSPDELFYNQISSGVMRVQLIPAQRQSSVLSQFKMIICSFGAPQLIGLRDSLSVHSLAEITADNIGN